MVDNTGNRKDTGVVMKTVLIVDDASEYAENMKFVLSRAGYEVVVAATGREGELAAARIRPNLILMDLLMPDQDGVETVMRIRENPVLKDIPVLFLTSVTASEDVVIPVKGKDYPGLSKLLDYPVIVNRVADLLAAQADII